VILMVNLNNDTERKLLEKKLLWDYDISLEQYLEYLYGREEEGWFDQDWALARAVNNLNYYELRELIPLELLAENWSKIKDKIRDPAVKNGLEFVLQRETVSSSG